MKNFFCGSLKKVTSLIAFGAIGCLAILTTSNAAKAAVEVVSPSNMGTWAFYSTDDNGTINTGSGTGQMVNGPGAPPLGTGSANLKTGNGVTGGDGSEQLRNSDWAGTKLADITSLSYATFATSFNGSQLPFVNLYINYTGGTTRDDRLWFEPTYSSAGASNDNPNTPQAAVALNTWQTWDMLTGMWYSDQGVPSSAFFPGDPNGPGDHAITWDAFVAAFPDAVIINDPGQGGLGGIRIASGLSSPDDVYDTNVDAFTIGTDGLTRTYDFELEEPSVVPEAASLQVWGLLSLVGGCGFWLRFGRKRLSATAGL